MTQTESMLRQLLASADLAFIDQAGLEQIWARVTVLLAAKYGQSETSSAISSALTDYYTKSETLSTAQIQALVANLNSIAILNKGDVDDGVVEATESTVGTVCTQYVQTNYSRAPKNWDGILVTLTDGNDDIVLYTYSEQSSSWVDISRNIAVSVSNATSETAGIAKLYNALGTQQDGGVTPSAVKAVTDQLNTQLLALQSAVSELQTALAGKADATALSTLQGTVTTLSQTVSANSGDIAQLETAVSGKADASTVSALTQTVAAKANAADVYKKTETYSKTEVDEALPRALTTEEIAEIIGSGNS